MFGRVTFAEDEVGEAMGDVQRLDGALSLLFVGRTRCDNNSSEQMCILEWCGGFGWVIERDESLRSGQESAATR